MLPFESFSALTPRILLPQVSSQLEDLISQEASLTEVLDDESCLRGYRTGNRVIVT
jgi:hypothetical protein